MITYQTIFEELKQLRSHLHGDFLIAEKTRIVELYQQVLHKQVKNLACADCYRDAYIELYAFIQKHKDEVLETHRFVLKDGEVIHFFGEAEYYKNPLPEKVAMRFLKMFPAGISKFAEYPDNWEAEEQESKEEDDPMDDAESDVTTTKKRGRPRKN